MTTNEGDTMQPRRCTLRKLREAYSARDVRIRGHVPRTWVLIDTTGRRISMGRTNVVRGRR